MVDRIGNEWYYVTSVKELGAYKALVTFTTKKDMGEEMTYTKVLLLNYFAEVRPWIEEKWCQIRRTWIECYWVPPYAWSTNNLKKIIEVWGMFVLMDNLQRRRNR